MTGSSFSGLRRSCYSGARVGPADEAVEKTTNQSLDQADLETIGIISLVIGVVLWILGSMGCQVGGPGGASARIRDRVGLVGGGAVSVRWPP